jgi:hypothetical protein
MKKARGSTSRRRSSWKERHKKKAIKAEHKHQPEQKRHKPRQSTSPPTQYRLRRYKARNSLQKAGSARIIESTALRINLIRQLKTTPTLIRCRHGRRKGTFTHDYEYRQKTTRRSTVTIAEKDKAETLFATNNNTPTKQEKESLISSRTKILGRGSLSKEASFLRESSFKPQRHSKEGSIDGSKDACFHRMKKKPELC